MSSTGARHRGSVGRHQQNNTPGSSKKDWVRTLRRWRKLLREGFIFDLEPLCCAKPVGWVEWSGVEWSGSGLSEDRPGMDGGTAGGNRVYV